MKIKGQYQWTDYLAAQLLSTQPNKFILYGAYSIIAIMFISMLYQFFTIGEQTIEGFIWLLLFLLVFVLAAFILPFLNRKVFLPKQVKKSFEQRKGMSLPFEKEFTDQGMHTSSEIGNTIIPWDHFTKWKENDDIIILYEGDALVHMLPKRLFADPQQLEMVQSLLQKYIATKDTSRVGQK